MKKNYINYLIVILTVLILGSCEKDPKGTIYSTPGLVSFVAPTYYPALSDNDGKVINVPINRTDKGAQLSVKVKLVSTLPNYTTVFTVPADASFAAGEAATNVKVAYSDLSLVDPTSLAISSTTGNEIAVSLAFPFKLELNDLTLVSPSKVSSTTVNASKLLNFGAATEGMINSINGWYGDEYSVDIKKAVGTNVYQVVSPFGYRNFAFMIKSDGKTVVCPNQVIDKHSSYGDVTMGSVTGSVTGKVVTLNVGAYTVSAGSFGGGVEIITLP
jgi:hypothetical protein